jgi:hypothetical protein
MATVSHSRYHQKRQWFFSPMHVPMSMQWWSYFGTQRSQKRQCFDRSG